MDLGWFMLALLLVFGIRGPSYSNFLASRHEMNQHAAVGSQRRLWISMVYTMSLSPYVLALAPIYVLEWYLDPSDSWSYSRSTSFVCAHRPGGG